jgi:hypothetical protein
VQQPIRVPERKNGVVTKDIILENLPKQRQHESSQRAERNKNLTSISYSSTTLEEDARRQQGNDSIF